MVENLKLIMKNSYANISKYKVAAIIVCENKQEIVGVNIENIDGKSGMCAEEVAISNAFIEGYQKKDFKEIHIMGSSKKICMPCFMCRELLHEFFMEEALVYCYNITGEVKTYKVKELCPYPFDLEEA